MHTKGQPYVHTYIRMYVGMHVHSIYSTHTNNRWKCVRGVVGTFVCLYNPPPPHPEIVTVVCLPWTEWLLSLSSLREGDPSNHGLLHSLRLTLHTQTRTSETSGVMGAHRETDSEGR